MKIIEDNIEDTASARAQFAIQTGSYTFDVPYDGGSVMHYGNTAFGRTVDGVIQTTIEPLVCKNIYFLNISNICICNRLMRLSWSSGFLPSFL